MQSAQRTQPTTPATVVLPFWVGGSIYNADVVNYSIFGHAYRLIYGHNNSLGAARYMWIIRINYVHILCGF